MELKYQHEKKDKGIIFMSNKDDSKNASVDEVSMDSLVNAPKSMEPIVIDIGPGHVGLIDLLGKEKSMSLTNSKTWCCSINPFDEPFGN